ncbi:VOC family protein [Heyndrickxia coagulans]|uniref:VOC family protein n=1 Tax=Heyndrickxia coagulans TaxID=1398 RepID=UPI0028FC0227|nr:VOC family protein [Heyndrickxia coagulans]MDT9755465.1 VOC family protein [Heyndrickxia coagulans]
MATPQLDFSSIQVRDLEKSREFYQNTLGFEIENENPGAYVFKNEKGASFAIRKPLVDLDRAGKLGWGVALWFSVPDVEKRYDDVRGKEVKIVKDLTDSPFGKVFTVDDPDGYYITFHG